jgi:hypothetical protein
MTTNVTQYGVLLSDLYRGTAWLQTRIEASKDPELINGLQWIKAMLEETIRERHQITEFYLRGEAGRGGEMLGSPAGPEFLAAPKI